MALLGNIRRLGLGTRRAALCAFAWAALSCAPSGFQDEAFINSVRILASAADKPYAKPGDTVNLTVLAFDGRPLKLEPMKIYWLPFVCTDPLNDAYYGCFAQIASGMGDGGSGAMGGGGADAGAGGGGGGGLGSLLKPGVDLSPILPTGPTFTFQMPADAITAHPKTEGVAQQYGLVILFNIACAGHIEIVPIDPNNINPQQVPIGCFDSNHKQVGPEDWVFGYTRVYAYDTITNANPVIASIDKDGKTIASPSSLPVSTSTPPDVGDATLDVTHCSGDKCPSVSLGPVVPASSQETQAQIPGNTKEEIWADFYTTIGSYDADARLLYDSVAGSLGGPKVTNNTFHPPDRAGAGFLWIVVHDSRGGASWVTLPVHAN